MNRVFFQNYKIIWDGLLGNREEQQDAVDIMSFGNNCCVTICDGMGGLYDGTAASQEAIYALHQHFEDSGTFNEPLEDIPAFLEKALQHMDDHVTRIQTEDGKNRQMGTTVVTAIIWDGMLFWMSVGDSRLYIFRNGELIQATRDHNYLYTLKQMYAKGVITEEKLREEQKKGGALTSYIGINGVDFYDVCRSPFHLKDHDIILLASDGIYKTINDAQMRTILGQERPLDDKAGAFTAIIHEASQNRAQDNASFVMIEWGNQGQ